MPARSRIIACAASCSSLRISSPRTWASPRFFAHARLSPRAREKLKRWHADVDCAFRSWSEPWLDPEFRQWDITEALGYIRVPILIVQGDNDQYGTLRQLDVAKEECFCPVETAILPGIRHDPCREAPDETLAATAGFINRLLREHHEAEKPAATPLAAT
jgi:pimeloyl-ACP methyl ester carboxylesterase